MSNTVRIWYQFLYRLLGPVQVYCDHQPPDDNESELHNMGVGRQGDGQARDPLNRQYLLQGIVTEQDLVRIAAK